MLLVQSRYDILIHSREKTVKGDFVCQMSPMPYAPEKRRALTAIFIVFLFIFSEILVAENDHESFLEEQEELGFAIYQYSTNTETSVSYTHLTLPTKA